MAQLSPITTARFWAKVAVSKEDTACWLWTGAVNGSGYGSFKVPELGRRHVSAHRVAYCLGCGEWPQGRG